MASSSIRSVVGLGLAVVMFAACTPGRVTLPSTGRDGEVANLARLTGTIRGDRALGCVWLSDANGNHTVLWPAGYTATFDPTTVYDAKGGVAGREGETISGAGASVAKGIYSVPDRCAVSADVWVLDIVTPAHGTTP